MPYKTEWVEPEVILTHKGLPVYATYKNGDVDSTRRRSWFTLDSLCGEDECNCAGATKCRNVFDVRELPNWKEPLHPPFLTGEGNTPENRKAWDEYYKNGVEEEHIKAIIRDAIDLGLLPQGGDLGPAEENSSARMPGSSAAEDGGHR